MRIPPPLLIFLKEFEMILDILTEEKDVLDFALSQFIRITECDYEASHGMLGCPNDYLKELKNQLLIARGLRSKIRQVS